MTDKDKAPEPEAVEIQDEQVLHVCSFCGQYAKWPSSFCGPKCAEAFMRWFKGAFPEAS